MCVLEYHQDGPAQRRGFKRAQQGFEQLLALALRTEVQIGGGIRQRQQLSQQCECGASGASAAPFLKPLNMSVFFAEQFFTERPFL
jgi:hypothetical protein